MKALNDQIFNLSRRPLTLSYSFSNRSLERPHFIQPNISALLRMPLLDIHVGLQRHFRCTNNSRRQDYSILQNLQKRNKLAAALNDSFGNWILSRSVGKIFHDLLSYLGKFFNVGDWVSGSTPLAQHSVRRWIIIKPAIDAIQSCHLRIKLLQQHPDFRNLLSYNSYAPYTDLILCCFCSAGCMLSLFLSCPCGTRGCIGGLNRETRNNYCDTRTYYRKNFIWCHARPPLRQPFCLSQPNLARAA